MIKSFKVVLLPNNKQATRLRETSGAARYAYNWTVAAQMEAFAGAGRYLSESDARKRFTEHKRENAWLYGVSNNATKQAVRDACDAFWRFLREKKKPDSVRHHKAAKDIKLPMSRIMLGCLLDPSELLAIAV